MRTRLARDIVLICSISVMAHNAPAQSEAQSAAIDNKSVVIRLPIATQGPLWPPSEVVDHDGNFILLGSVLTEVQPGVIQPVPQQAVIVSKETVPALGPDGVEDPDNWFAATHKVLRKLDLSRGSRDLKMVLHSLSFGPFEGSGRSPRIPRIGESTYNLNGDLTICPDILPTESQRFNYFLPSFPLHQVPVNGFQGDQVAYDPNTGSEFDPATATDDPACAAQGCPGEDVVDVRRRKPITLGDWLKSDGTLKIQLVKPNKKGQYTAARFSFSLKSMIPNSIYTVWAVRPREIPIPGVFHRRDIDPLFSPNVITTDGQGRGSAEWEVTNPFPDPATDTRGFRIFGISVVYHSNLQNWGACPSPYGPGVDVHAVFNTLNGTRPDITDFVTVAP